MELICTLILESSAGMNPHCHLISVDEKTGIQALERLEDRAPSSRGGHWRREFEYTRHGTTTLIAGYDLADGKVVHQRIHPTRKEEDFLIFIQQTAALFPQQDQLIFLADQLNTHMSASLVQWIAEQIGFGQDLGKKGYKGILKSKITRKAFLEDPAHRIRFVFTPKHCSWLNPVENWFAKIQRHILTHGNFTSIKELEQAIYDYIIYYNRCLRKPIRWKFKGFFKRHQLKNSTPICA